jgi:hypothetical protein
MLIIMLCVFLVERRTRFLTVSKNDKLSLSENKLLSIRCGTEKEEVGL